MSDPETELTDAHASPHEPPGQDPQRAAPVESNDVLQFLVRLAQALLASGEQTATVELTMRRAASAYGLRRSRVVAFPTAVFISADDATGEKVTLAEGPTQTLRLDQFGDVYELRDLAQRGAVDPSEGRQRLTRILRQPPRFGALGQIVGHMVLSFGVALVLMPTWMNVLASGILGVLVGCLKFVNRDRAVLAVPLPVIASATVAAAVFSAMRWGAPIEPLHALVPPLVSFLPGAMLSLGMIELAYGDMVSGASRLTAGGIQLILLAFGLVAGAALAGYSPESLVDESPVSLGLQWRVAASWIGVVVFGIGVFLHFSAPQRSFPWMLLALLTAFAAQQAAAPFVGKSGSGFFGMLAVTPLGYLIHLRFGGPPAMVTFLPSFWLLVPGALSLVSMKYMLTDRGASVDGLIDVAFVFVAIALGTLMGASLYKNATERFGAWTLQIGRVERYFRRK